MKVIIADDEVFICSLIKNIIDWDALGLTLLGVFHNGNDVLAQFEKEAADILICDIEMPGMSGTELIKQIAASYPECRCMVISGFRNFEYAQSAMQYGVTNYLLKPIDGDELNAVLGAMVQSSQSRPNTPDVISEQAMRLGLVDFLQFDFVNETLSNINKTYHYRFCAGEFNIVKAVFTEIDINSDFLPRIINLFSESLKQKLLDFCCDVEVFRMSPVYALMIINYENENKGLLRSVLEQSLRDTLVDLGGKTQCKCVIGVGTPVGDINGLRESLKSAERVVCDRLKDENRQIFYAEFMDKKISQTKPPALSWEEKNALSGLIETVDVIGISNWLADYFTEHEKSFREHPNYVLKFCLDVADILLRIFDELGVPVKNKESFRKRIEIMFDNCRGIADVKKALLKIIGEQCSERLHEKQQNMAVYAQQVKNYIDKHYAETVTLEIIADKLHISPVYLSIVFKAETGMNYSKYLASVRIEKSKELLRNHDMNLSQVANAVGYDSTSYYSNLFRKHIGIGPSEYRRLHQHDIGD